jgi:CheY-like chemotaxis protein
MKTINILLVDDSEADIMLITEAITTTVSDYSHTIDVAKNGAEALYRLNKTGGDGDLQAPDLILLDINMPVMSGHELLDKIKADDKTKHIPVIMFTTSRSKKDILKSYQKYSNSYIVKPALFQDYEAVVNQINNFWLDTAMLPNE